MASLAALDLKRRWPSSRLCVYTYGQPRVGNRAFANEYEGLVPDHWSVVCNQVGSGLKSCAALQRGVRRLVFWR